MTTLAPSAAAARTIAAPMPLLPPVTTMTLFSSSTAPPSRNGCRSASFRRPLDANRTPPGPTAAERRDGRAAGEAFVRGLGTLGRVPRAATLQPISPRIANIAESATLRVDSKAKALAAAGRPIVSFAAGQPDFDTPAHVVEAAERAARDPRNHHYTAAVGLPDLREAIAAKTLRDSGVEVSPAQVIVTNGGKQAVYEAVQVLVGDGDEVLVPSPYWVTYPEVVKLAGGVPGGGFAGADAGSKGA